MIDFIFKDNQSPDINAANLNILVEAINSNENKANDLQSEISELVVEKGGSIVQANPQEEPTEKMKAIRINNDVFEVASETGIDMTYEDYMALVEADEDDPEANYFVEDAPTSSVPIAEEFEKVYSELDDLKASLNNVQEGTVTVNVGTKNNDYTWCLKLGKLVIVALYVTGVTTSTGTYQTVVKLPFKPIKKFFWKSATNDWAVDSNGALSRYAGVSNDTIVGTFSYFTND